MEKKENKNYILNNQEILGGLKIAIASGDTLQEAMMSFYQAGYGKEEIEEAARKYLSQDDSVIEKPIKKEEKNNLEKKEKKSLFKFAKSKDKKEITSLNKEKVPKPTENSSEAPSPVEEKVVTKKIPQRVSKYGKSSLNKKTKTLSLILIGALLILIGALILIFLFREELIQFVNNIFG
jgi:hypothetical protein